jgi:hypothetical protein
MLIVPSTGVKMVLIGDRLEITVDKGIVTVRLLNGTYRLYEWKAAYREGDTLPLSGVEVRVPLEVPT